MMAQYRVTAGARRFDDKILVHFSLTILVFFVESSFMLLVLANHVVSFSSPKQLEMVLKFCWTFWLCPSSRPNESLVTRCNVQLR